MPVRFLLRVSLAVALTQSAFARHDPNIAARLNLDRTNLAARAVYYEPSLETQLPAFEKAYRRFLDQIADNSKMVDRLLAKKQAIVADINRILEPAGLPLSEQYELLVGAAKADLRPNPVFHLVTQKTIKDFLRAGGKLPDFVYDKPTDTVSYLARFEQSSESLSAEQFDIVIPVPSENEFEPKVNRFFDTMTSSLLRRSVLGLAVHEVVEATFIHKVKPQGPYWRWFSDGLADAFAIELLETHLGRETAQAYHSSRNPQDYSDLQKELNLAHWMMLKYCAMRMGGPLESEDRLNIARYAYSMAEVKRLIEDHSLECIRQICTDLAARQTRTSEDLFDVIKQTTGENMQERLAQYQTFTTPQEGTKKYATRFNEASDKKDYEQMLVNLLRVMELHEFQYSPDNLQSWRNAAILLFRMGHADIADEVMHNCVELFSESPVPNGRAAAMETFLVYTLKCSRPLAGGNVAEDLLKIDPDNKIALSVKMLCRAHAGRLAEAKELAQKIVTLTQNDKSPAYQTARRILAIEPNQQNKDAKPDANQ
jgi:hypothetical protein